MNTLITHNETYIKTGPESSRDTAGIGGLMSTGAVDMSNDPRARELLLVEANNKARIATVKTELAIRDLAAEVNKSEEIRVRITLANRDLQEKENELEKIRQSICCLPSEREKRLMFRLENECKGLKQTKRKFEDDFAIYLARTGNVTQFDMSVDLNKGITKFSGNEQPTYEGRVMASGIASPKG
jgi:hypothetical protein